MQIRFVARLGFLALVIFSSELASAAPITVTNTSDDGPGSLRQAVLDSAVHGDTIVFALALAGQTIILTTQDPQAQISNPAANVPAPFGPTGLVVNGKTLIIDGAAAPGLVISGGNQQRIFTVTGAGGHGSPLPTTPGVLTLRHLTLRDGFAKGGDGGAGQIYPGGGAAGMGGAVFVDTAATLYLDRCLLTESVAQGGHGGVRSHPFTDFGGGGGIGTAAVDLSGGGPNTAYWNGVSYVPAGFGGGGGSGATAGGFGGGGSGADNSSNVGGDGGVGGGGGSDPYAHSGRGNGGGGDGSDGIGGGGAGLGGCVMSLGSVVVSNSSGVACRARGGLSTAGSSDIVETVDGAAQGAAIYAYYYGTLRVSFSTFAHNTVAVGPNAKGDSAGAIWSVGFSTQLDSSIVWATTVQGAGTSVLDLVANGSTDGANNILGSMLDLNAGIEWASADPLLGLLADNGGPTRTIALLPGSGAHHAGNATLAALAFSAGADGVDQRGTPRAGLVDIGAYEVQPCATNEFVTANICTACAAGATRPAGDDPLGADTACAATICAADHHVVDHACVACAPGAQRAAGDLTTADDTACTAIVCEANQHVTSHACIACAAGTERAAGDLTTGDDTACTAIAAGAEGDPGAGSTSGEDTAAGAEPASNARPAKRGCAAYSGGRHPLDSAVIMFVAACFAAASRKRRTSSLKHNRA